MGKKEGRGWGRDKEGLGRGGMVKGGRGKEGEMFQPPTFFVHAPPMHLILIEIFKNSVSRQRPCCLGMEVGPSRLGRPGV